MKNNTIYPGTQSVHRALQLLKTFSDDHPEWGLKELALECDLNKTTAYRLLMALEREGMLMRDQGTKCFRLGPEAIALGARAMRANGLWRAAGPALEFLAEKSGETATLEILVGAETLVLGEETGSNVLRPTQFTGNRWPAHITPGGRVLLAEYSQSDLKRILTEPLQRYTKYTVTNLDELANLLDSIHQQGYAVIVDEAELGYIEIAAPVKNHDGKVVAALGMGGSSRRLPVEELEHFIILVKEAADRVSVNLGFKLNGVIE